MRTIKANAKGFHEAMKKLIGLFKTAICLLLLHTGHVQAAQSITFFHNDVLGSPVAVTDINGDLCWREDYRPYGEKILNNDDQDSANPLCGLDDNQRGYTNHVHDKDIGLTYMQARYYDPAIGRFMGVDPIGLRLNYQASFNRYAYAHNNPYKYTDPDGEFGVVGGVVGAVVSAGLAALAGESIEGIGVAAVSGAVAGATGYGLLGLATDIGLNAMLDNKDELDENSMKEKAANTAMEGVVGTVSNVTNGLLGKTKLGQVSKVTKTIGNYVEDILDDVPAELSKSIISNTLTDELLDKENSNQPNESENGFNGLADANDGYI